MKKFYFIFFLGFSHYSFGQTYSFDLYYSVPTQKYCWDGQYGFSVNGGTSNTKISELIKHKIHYVEDIYEEYFSVPNYSQFKITIKSTCLSKNGESSCDGDETRIVSAISLIKNGSVALYRCVDESLIVNKFKPNVTIKNLNTENPSEVCAGSQLELAAFPAGFPDEAYHWQYSLDNKTTWIDVPDLIGNKKTNNSKTTNFNMQELLGDNNLNYINKPIYFKLGYDQNRDFTDPILINYSACTLVIKDRKYIAPKCNGEPVQSIVVYFDRDLENNETLLPFQLIPHPKQPGDPISFSQNRVTKLIYDPETKWYKYSFIIPENEKLENRNYAIEYQSQVHGVPRGTLISDEPFLYKEPAPLKFEIKKADNPICTNDPVELSIAVTGGTGEYKFYVDGVEKTNPKPVKEADGYYHIKGLIPTAVNSIKVMDENNCIEKTL